MPTSSAFDTDDDVKDCAHKGSALANKINPSKKESPEISFEVGCPRGKKVNIYSRDFGRSCGTGPPGRKEQQTLEESGEGGTRVITPELKQNVGTGGRELGTVLRFKRKGGTNFPQPRWPYGKSGSLTRGWKERFPKEPKILIPNTMIIILRIIIILIIN